MLSLRMSISVALRVQRDDLRGEAIADLLRYHVQDLRGLSPAESCHALDLDKLRQPSITFWSVWSGDELAGCGALKELDPTHGEIKSMRTVPSHLRRGVASTVLATIIQTARERGYSRVSLETGSTPPFHAGQRLYEKFGFKQCRPFGDYRDDPHSRFYTLEL